LERKKERERRKERTERERKEVLVDVEEPVSPSFLPFSFFSLFFPRQITIFLAYCCCCCSVSSLTSEED